MVDTRLPKRSMLLTEEVPELDPQTVDADDEDDDLVESNQCSFSLLYSDDELATANEADHSGSRTGPDFTNLSSSLTDAIVSSPSSSSNSVDESSLTRLSEARPNAGCITSGNARAKHDRRTAKQLTERKRRDRINALLDTLRNLILRLLRKNPRHHRKLEKADILELVVSFLKRELQKSRQPSEPRTESKPTAIQSNHPVQIPKNSEMNYSPNMTCFAPDMSSSSSTNISVTSQPTLYDPYLSNFSIPMSQQSPTPYMFVTDPAQHAIVYPTNCPTTGFYPFQQYNGTVPPNSDTTVPLSAVTNNRRPLGSIENMNRILPNQFTPMQTILGSGRSPMKELRQAQKAFTPVGAYARAFIGSEGAHKARPMNNENEGNYSHLKNVLNSTPSQSLWRPYI
ncbi:hypothetical protein D915_006639 [Fasciola hepatica]|uniref:BHLH domain-containing protein n=1 Tax=Fasciola hepatica TaxID=6192 RepID=A0A4E0RPJ7_FASHE|nr:hypothetical protein D915_006639 [Fasciola hepatica]